MNTKRLLQCLILVLIVMAMAITMARGQSSAHVVLKKAGFIIDYNRQTATPIRVDWTLTKAKLTPFNRSDSPFLADHTLPRGWYVAHADDYAGTGYDRGHLCPAGDKQAATFVLSNIAPQAPSLNRQSWAHLEVYCRNQARAGYRVAISAGVCDSLTSIAHGHITVPRYFWKVVRLSAAGKPSRTLYLLFPNTNAAGGLPWPTFTVTMAALQTKIGFTF